MPVLEENLGIKEDQASSTGPGCWGGLGRDAGGGLGEHQERQPHKRGHPPAAPVFPPLAGSQGSAVIPD